MILKSFNPIKQRNQLEQLWAQLSERKDQSYFTSKGWLSAWLDSLPSHIKLDAHVALHNDIPEYLFFTGRHESIFKRLSNQKNITFNATGSRYYDDGLWVEYNEFIGEAHHASLKEVLSQLYKNSWTALHIPGIPEGSALHQSITATLNEQKEFKGTIESSLPSYFVSLKKLTNPSDYLASLSKNTRKQLLQSIRSYEKTFNSQITTQTPATLTEAMAYFDHLVELHTESFKARKKKSNFASPFALNFHRRLIAQRFDHGEIFLQKTMCGEEVIGYLYNLRYNAKVFYFQSGFNYRHANNKLKPGIVCHFQAISSLIGSEVSEYDFLAGNERYKKSLGTQYRTLNWITIQKAGLAANMSHSSKRIKHLAKQQLGSTR